MLYVAAMAFNLLISDESCISSKFSNPWPHKLCIDFAQKSNAKLTIGFYNIQQDHDNQVYPTVVLSLMLQYHDTVTIVDAMHHWLSMSLSIQKPHFSILRIIQVEISFYTEVNQKRILLHSSKYFLAPINSRNRLVHSDDAKNNSQIIIIISPRKKLFLHQSYPLETE